MYNRWYVRFFWFDPEKVQLPTFSPIRLAAQNGDFSSIYKITLVWLDDKRLETEVFGLKFKKPAGLAAGFDKGCQVV
jgi:dihydroorotate dehydrogenase